MKISFKIYIGLYLVCSSTNANDKFLIVTPFSNEISSCPNLERLRIKHHSLVEEGNQTKAEACTTIAASDFLYETLHVLPISSHRSPVYNRTSAIKLSSNITGPYEERKIVIDGNMSYEAVFPCLVWNYDTGNYSEIFISRQYDYDHDFSEIFSAHFRLVFQPDETGKLRAIAVAEKPAEVVVYYKEGHSLAELEKKIRDPDDICNLSKNMKLRICTIILNAEEFRHEVEFSPSANKEEPTCNDEGSMIFQYLYQETSRNIEESDTRDHFENLPTLECKATKRHRRIGFHETAVYYIGRDKYSNSYFIADSDRNVVGECEI